MNSIRKIQIQKRYLRRFRRLNLTLQTLACYFPLRLREQQLFGTFDATAIIQHACFTMPRFIAPKVRGVTMYVYFLLKSLFTCIFKFYPQNKRLNGRRMEMSFFAANALKKLKCGTFVEMTPHAKSSKCPSTPAQSPLCDVCTIFRLFCGIAVVFCIFCNNL